MGDIRNKLAKIERAMRQKAAYDAWRAAYGKSASRTNPPSVHATQPQQCACGHRPDQAELIAVDIGGWPRQQRLYCRACVPEQYREDMQRALDLNMLGRVSR